MKSVTRTGATTRVGLGWPESLRGGSPEWQRGDLVKSLRSDLVESLRGGLIVSCQAYPGEPMRDPRTMAQLAAAVQNGGAVAVRVQGLDDIAATLAAVGVPVIGLVKTGQAGVSITPTLDDCLAVAATGCQVVALDGTRRARPDGRSLASTVTALRERHPEVVVMADCGSLDDALAAQSAGVDLIGTTLAGYTGERPRTDGPDWDLVDQLVAHLTVPVVVEGRVHSPAQAAEALRRGAHTVCVGTAITHPSTITGWFVDALSMPLADPGFGDSGSGDSGSGDSGSGDRGRGA